MKERTKIISLGDLITKARAEHECLEHAGVSAIYLAASEASEILKNSSDITENDDGTYGYLGIPVIIYRFANNHMVMFKVNIVTYFSTE